MIRCTRGQVVKFRYHKIGHGVSSAQYKGRIIKIIPTPNGRDILLEMGNSLIRRFHAKCVIRAKRVGIIERLCDWLRGTTYQLPIV